MSRLVRSSRPLGLAALLLALAALASPAASATLENAEHGMSLELPEGWEAIDEADIPSEAREGLVFAVKRLEDGASLQVKATSRQARAGEGERYAQLLKRRGGVAADERVVIGGVEGWRIVRIADEGGEPLVRSTVFLPYRGLLYMITGNIVGLDDPEAVRAFRPLESALTLSDAGGPDMTPTEPVDLPAGVHAALPKGWTTLTDRQVSQILPESFGTVEGAFFSPDEDQLFYVSHVGEKGILSSAENLVEIGDQFESQLLELPGARILNRSNETLAERPAHRIVYEIVQPDGNRILETRVITMREGQLLLVGGLALQARSSDALAVFDGIFGTVRIDAPAVGVTEVAEAVPEPSGQGLAAPDKKFPRGRGLLPRAYPEQYYEDE